MLDRLEGADRPPELLALAYVLHGAGERLAGRADRLGGEHGGGGAPGGGEGPEDVGPFVTQQLGGHIAKFDPGLRAGLVEHGLPGAHEPGRVLPYEEQQRAAAGEAARVRGDQQQRGAVPVEHLRDLPVQPPAAAGRVGAGLHPARAAAAGPVPGGVLAGQRECGGQRRPGNGEGGGQPAGGQRREQRGALGPGAEGRDQGYAERGGRQQRRREQHPAGLLAGQGQVGGGAADAAVLLGDGDARQAELPGELLPQLAVVAGGGADGGLDLVGAAAFAQDLAQGTPYLVLLRGEGGIHRRAPPRAVSDGPSC